MDIEYADALQSGDWNGAELRAALTGRGIYTLADTEDPANLTANVDGRIPLGISWHNIIFWLDPDDTTTAQDGVTVIKTSDSYVYKVEDTDYRIRAVLSDTATAPPGSPSVGDAYLVPAGATGAWSSHQDDIAIFTRNGWRFEVPGIGKWLLIEDVDGFKRYTAGGWLYGPGARSFDANSIPLSAALGFGERIIVEDQTTNAPPTATKGLRYIVGPIPTGVWLGKAGQIAICEVAGTWTFYPPGNGWAAYDKARNTNFTFNGTAWVSAAGAFVDTATATYAANADLSATIPLDDTIPQIGEGTQIITTTFTPKSTTNKLRVRFEGVAAHNTASGYAIAALFLNSNANAIAADFKGGTPANAGLPFLIIHEFVPGVTSSITLSVRVGPATSGGGLIRFNGSTAGRLLGGVMAARLIIEEIPA